MSTATHSAQPFTSATPAKPTPLRILWADDDEIIRRVGRAILTGGGHTVTTVNDGWDAVAQITAKPDGWDVLITDHDMPMLDGLSLVRQLPRLRFNGRVIVVSGSIDEQLAKHYHQCNVEAIVRKPFESKELLAIVGSAQRP